MKTLVGIRPTGRLHIGHYFSVIKPALEEDVDVLIADYHVSPFDFDKGEEMQKFLAKRFGIYAETQVVTPFRFFDLLSVAKMGELKRMTQYKSTKKKTPHLLIYPVLMAYDLIGYDKVIVGDDQKQHVEYANVLFKRLGLPKIKGDYRGSRIMSLSNPSEKMSKSDPKGCLFLDEDPTKKVMKAVTTKKGRKNLENLYKMLGGKKPPELNKDLKLEIIVKLKKINE